MSVAIKREIIEDQSEIVDIACAEPVKKKVRTARKCAAPGGKVPRQAIKSKPVRKMSLPARKMSLPARVMPMRSARTRSKSLVVQTIEDDDSDIEFLDDSSSSISEYEKNRMNNIKEREDMFKKLDIDGAKKICSKKGLNISVVKSKKKAAKSKSNINNNSKSAMEESDIEVIDETDDIICDETDDIICESDVKESNDIVCEPDITLESDDIICEPDVNTINSDDIVCEPDVVDIESDIICEPDVNIMESDPEEPLEIEVIDSSEKISTKTEKSKSKKKYKMHDDQHSPIEESEIEVIEESDLEIIKETNESTAILDEINLELDRIKELNEDEEIICESDINAETNDEELSEIQMIDSLQVSNKETENKKSNLSSESNPEESSEIEVIEYSELLQEPKKNEDNNEIICGPEVYLESEEPLEIEVIEYSDENPLKKLNGTSKTIIEDYMPSTDIEENLMDTFPQFITL